MALNPNDPRITGPVFPGAPLPPPPPGATGVAQGAPLPATPAPPPALGPTQTDPFNPSNVAPGAAINPTDPRGQPGSGPGGGHGGIVVGQPSCPDGSRPSLRFVTGADGVARQKWVCGDGTQIDPVGPGQVPPATPRAPQSGGGGDGGSGASASAAASGFGPAPTVTPQRTFSDPLQGELDALLTRILQGDERAFPESLTRDTLARLRQIQAGQDEQAQESINQDAVRRGVFRSPITSDLQAEARATNRAQFSQSATDFFVAQAEAEFQQKMGALQGAMQELDSRRRLFLGQETNAIDRDLGLAQIDMARLRLREEMRNAGLERDLRIQLSRMGLLQTLLG